MKNSHFKNIEQELKKISLDSHEKQVLFDKLDAYASSHQPIHSPYYTFSHWMQYATKYVTKPKSLVIASLLFITITGSGSVFASEHALPGDILYPIKIHIAEPLKLTFAGDIDTKQKVQVAQVGERLKEVEVLATQGRLATSTSDNAQVMIKDQLDSIKKDLSNKNKDALDATLSTHDNVLESIKQHVPDASQKSHIEHVQDVISHDQGSQSDENKGQDTKNQDKDKGNKLFHKDFLDPSK